MIISFFTDQVPSLLSISSRCHQITVEGSLRIETFGVDSIVHRPTVAVKKEIVRTLRSRILRDPSPW